MPLRRLAALRYACEEGSWNPAFPEPSQLGLFDKEVPEERLARLMQGWGERGFRCLTPEDEEFPRRLSSPFLFVQGDYRRADFERSVAIIGTRKASPEGRRRASRLARALTEAGVTVVSGLALGIDGAAHEGALAAPGGRTVAVVGTGLETIYPPENHALHGRVLQAGAVLSQFWPDFTGMRQGANFLARNRTMADLTLATVVVEASVRSGARSQAVYAQKSGGRVMLLRSLLLAEAWAQEMVEKPGCYAIDEVEDVLRGLDTVEHSPGDAAAD